MTAAGGNTNRGQISYLQGLREDLSRPGGLTIESMQALRTNMRGQLSERGLTATDADRRVGQVITAANSDLSRDLPPAAGQALRAADDFYRERQGIISGTLKAFLGDKRNPLAPEAAGSRLVSMAKSKGDFDRFSRMWNELAPDERADAAATIASTLGRAGNGDFSVGTLIKNLDPKQGLNPRAARLVFGEDGAKALADLRIVAQSKAATSQALNNSRTGVTVSSELGGLKTMVAAALGFTAGGPGAAAAGAVGRSFISRWGEERAARTLLNPSFAKWLKLAPNTSDPARIEQHLSKLTTTAVNSPAFAADVKAFRSAFSEFLDAPMLSRAAADDAEEKRKNQR